MGRPPKNQSKLAMALRSYSPLELTEAIAWILIYSVVPLAGVFYYGWSAYEVIVLYVCETVIVGVFNFFRIYFAGTKTDLTDTTGLNSPKGVAFFFLIHYGIFVGVQSIFIFIAIEPDEQFDIKEFLLCIAGLFLTHLFYFLIDYVIRGRYKTTDPNTQMFAPYGRIFVQQFLAIGGGFLVAGFDESNNKTYLIALIILKTVIDLAMVFAKPFYFKDKAKSFS